MPIPAQPWYDKAAFEVVRNGVTLFQYVNEADLGLRKSECDAIEKTPEFQAAVRAERNKLYKELALDPQRSRNTAVGQLLFLVQKLTEAEQYDKAVAALTQLFKVEGWNKEANNITNIFQEISGKDLSALRKRLDRKQPQLPN